MADRRGSVESPPSPYRSSATGGGANARLTPPMDPWRARGLNPQPQYGHNIGPHLQHNRPVLPVLPPPPVFGQHFPPTGGPHIPPNMAQSSAVNAGRQYDTGGGGFQDQDYRTTSTSAPPIQRHNPYADSSRPVWPPDATQRADDANDLYANIDIDNIDSLRDALQNANRLAGGATAGTAPIAADSTTLTVTETVASTAATNDPMTELIARMQVIDAELSAKMESSRKAKSEIEVLDAALKDYEYKFKLRNNLRLASDAIDKDVDQLNKRRTALTAQMKVYNESHRSASSATSLPTPTVAPIARPPVDHSASSLLSTTSTADERQGQSSQRRPQQKERPQHLRPALTTHSSPTTVKRPNTLHTKPAANPKRVRINDVVSNTTPTAPVRTTPSLHTGLKPAIKRTPHPFRPKPALGTPTTPLATASPSTDSPKVSRLCRQQTPGPGGPRSTGLAPAPSGVRTSRPVRPGCSRANRTDNESTEATEPSEPTHTSDQPMDNTEAADSAVDSADEAVSDNEIFNELVNTNIMNEKAAEEDAPVVNRTPNTATTAATATQSTVNSDEILDNSVTTGDQRDGSEPQPAPQDNAVNTGGDEIDGNDGPNAEPDVVTIDSDDEDEVFTAETQPTINVKTEKPDAMNGGNHSLNAAATRVLSDSATDLNASSAASDDSMASTSTSSTLSSTFNKKSLRYTGFPAVEYERTDGQEYNLGPFKPIFGPKSKTAGVGVITMKAFKDYLIASLADNTVRRFHIQNKSDVGMYGPHGNHVMALMIVESAKCADDYYLYTACKDKALRVFNARTTQLMGGISLGHTIYCLDYRWSHVFCGLENGTVCKVAAIHELESPPQVSADGAANTGGDTYEHLVKRYAVDAKKRILALVAVKATATVALPVDIEPVMAISHTKLRIVNTSDSVVNDKDRVLHSMPLNASNASPIFAKVFGDHLFLAFKVVGFKPEGQTKPNKDDDKSLLLMYDLQKDWNYVNKLEIPGVIMALEMSGSDLIVCEYSGSVQCFACDHQFDFKWKAHPSVTISACVQLGSRLVLGTGSGQFEVIFLDQNPVDCDLCGITFVRDMDLKHHIKNEHNLSEPPAIGQ